MLESRRALAVAAFVVALPGCRHAERGAEVTRRDAAWRALADGYLEETFRARPEVGARVGRHELDGGISDLSPAGWAREAVRLRETRARAKAVEAASLSEDARYERGLLLADVERELFWIERARAPWRNCMYTVDHLDPTVYALRPYAPLEVRARALATYARNVPRAATQIRALLEEPLARPHAETCASIYEGLAAFLEKDAPETFATLGDPQVREELAAALGPAAAAVRDLARWFRERLPTATGAFALGPGLFAELLRATEGLDQGIAELEEIARRDTEANLASLREACAAYAPGAELADCVERVAARKPPDGAVARARAQLPDLRRFVEERELVTIPSSDEARVDASPPFARFNSAFLDAPGPFDRGVPAVYYVAPPDPSWSEEEQRAYVPAEADLLMVSVHEVWPGHFLHWQHLMRARWPVARVTASAVFAEGWAHYAELLVWTEGYGRQDPEVRIAQLQNALFRDVRFLSAIGLHAKQMTVEESERLFREVGFLDPGNARQQARRGTFDPGYFSYTLGKLLLLELRETWRARNPGASLRDFHDRLLSLGAPPLPLARARLLGEPLP